MQLTIWQQFFIHFNRHFSIIKKNDTFVSRKNQFAQAYENAHYMQMILQTCSKNIIAFNDVVYTCIKKMANKKQHVLNGNIFYNLK